MSYSHGFVEAGHDLAAKQQQQMGGNSDWRKSESTQARCRAPELAASPEERFRSYQEAQQQFSKVAFWIRQRKWGWGGAGK